MYIAIQKDGCMIRYVAVCGTSQLEGYHKHLIDLFVGANYSAALAGALVTMFNFRWGLGVACDSCLGMAVAIDCAKVFSCLLVVIHGDESYVSHGKLA